ncbi:MAG: hypothetical protein KKB00_06825 [Gammaproteobacteria bacterium]|nr:hypothetical protein [Gammaproteobacteria bacterium]
MLANILHRIFLHFILLDDIRYGWRLWRFERLRWWFLALAWGLFCGLLVIVVQLANRLSDDRPGWAGTKEPLYTLSYSLQGQMMSSKGNHLNLIAFTTGVSDYSKFVISNKQVMFNGQPQQLKLMFYDDALFRLLEPDPVMLAPNGGSGIYITAAFSKSQLLSKSTVQIQQADLPVSQLKSADFDKFAGKPVDMYLPMTYLAQWFPFVTANSTESQTLLNALPLYHAIIKVQPDFVPRASQQKLQQAIDLVIDEVVSINLAPQVRLVPGVELYPEQKAEITRQLWLLSAMLCAFSVMLFSNYFSVMANQAVVRSQEFSLQYAIGAALPQQIRQLCGENLLFFISIFLFASFFAYGIHHQLYSSQMYQSYFGVSAAFSWKLWFLTLLGCEMLIIITALLPMLNLLKQQHFQRTLGGVTRLQRVLLQLQFVAQVFLTMTALGLCFSAAYQEWQKQQVSVIDNQITGYQLNRQDGKLFSLPDPLVRGDSKTIAVSSEALVRQHAPFYASQLLGLQTVTPVYTDAMFVSDNYFALLDAKMVVPGRTGLQQVVINQTLADKLAVGSNVHSLIGKSIQIADMAQGEQLQIAGIVQDIPHAGTRHKHLPMLYRSLQDQRLSAGPLYIYSQTEQVPDTLLVLTNQNSSLVAVTPLGQLTAQLLALDGAGTGLFMLTMQVTVCIVVLIALGLYYQVNTQLTNDRQLFGLQLAMGQRRGQLGLELCLRHLILSAIAAVCFIGLMAVLATSAEALNLSLLSALPITFTVLLVVSSILLVTGLAVANLTRPSLRQLLAP